jgi:Phosphotransferase enzyme family
VNSPLELLHPTGSVGEVVVLGSALRPELARPRSAAPGSSALVVLAPSSEECRRHGYLASAVARLAAHVNDTGIAYVVAPLGRRRELIRLLNAAGLRAQASYLHLPGARMASHLVPPEPFFIRHVLDNLMLTQRAKRVLVERALSSRFTARRSASFLPAGIVFAPPGAAPPLEWLRSDEYSAAILSVGRAGRSAILHAFGEGRREPDAVLKIGLTEGARLARVHEAAMLASLAGGASDAGADVPTLIDVGNGGDGVLGERALAGRPVAASLVDDPRLLPTVLERLALWLQRWHRVTQRESGSEPVAERILGSARMLEGDLGADAAAYLARLEALCAEQASHSIKLVAAHNDLTMVNVLRAESERLAVLDWEVAEERGLPLTDFFYAAADAVAATTRYADRVAAFQTTFGRAGPTATHVRALAQSLAGELELSPSFVELCFHACWLMHASNEARASHASAPRPFFEIVRRLASGWSLTAASAGNRQTR